MESGGIAPSFLTSALDGRKWSAPRICHFTSGNSSRYTLYMKLDGLQSRSGHYEKEKNLPLLESNPESLAIQPVSSWAI
jgi:hypothetical protein